MDKIKIGKYEYTEEELERQFAEATRRGKEQTANSPKAERAYYLAKEKKLVVDLQNGVTFIVPTHLIQIFQNASDEEIADIEILLNGLYLRWNKLDEDLTVEHLAAGIFGTAKWMSSLREHLSKLGKKGGSSRSDAKRRASAENGKKGGRPKKKVA